MAALNNLDSNERALVAQAISFRSIESNPLPLARRWLAARTHQSDSSFCSVPVNQIGKRTLGPYFRRLQNVTGKDRAACSDIELPTTLPCVFDWHQFPCRLATR